MKSIIYSTLLFLTTSFSIHAQICDDDLIMAIYCFASVEIPMSATCNALITPEDVIFNFCEDRTYEVRLEDEFGNPLFNPLDASLIGTTITFYAKDVVLDTECIGEISLVDNTPPFIDFVGAPATLSCQDDFKDLIVVGTFDNCGESRAKLIDVNIKCTTCESDSVYLTYLAEDEYGNSTEEIKGFEFIDFCLDVEFPEDIEVACPQEIEDVAGFVTISDSDACVTDFVINFSDIKVGCDITRIWTVTEECSGRSIVHSQIIDVVDDTPPIVNVPAVDETISIYEINDGYRPPYTVEESCPGTINIIEKQVKDVFSCNPTSFLMLYTISSIDACGFTSEPVERLVMVEGDGPSKVKIKGTKNCFSDFVLNAEIKNLVEPVTYTWSSTISGWGITPIDDGQSVNISPFRGTTYIRVVAVDALGCEVAESKKIVCNGLGFGKKRNNLLTIYPNPIHEFVMIESNDEIYSIEINSIRGSKILDIDTKGEVQYNLDMSKFSSGIYYLKIYTEEGVHIEKIIKM